MSICESYFGHLFLVFTVLYYTIFHAFAELYSEHRQLLVYSLCYKENLHLFAYLVLSRHQGVAHQEVVDLPFFQTH